MEDTQEDSIARPIRWRGWVLGGATLAGLVYVVLRLGELEHLAQVLRQTDWRWLPLALVSEAFFQCNEGAIYWMMYKIMGYRARLAHVIALTLAASFVNRVAPSAGMSGTTLFAERMARKGIPPGRTITVNLARYLLDYGAFLLVLASGLLYLSLHQSLTALEVRAALVFGVIVLAVLTFVGILIASRSRLARAASSLSRLVNRVGQRMFRRSLLTEEDTARHVEEVLAAMSLLGRARQRTAALVVMGFFIHIFDLLGLWIVFHAIGYPVHLGIMIAGYGLGYLAGFISLVPSGLGVFEATMTAVYKSLGLPLEVAALATLLYRLFSLWAPLLAGYLALHLVVVDDTAS